MTTPIQKRLFTVAEYHEMAKAGILEERGLELIHGEIIEMSPIGSKHAKYVNILFRLFGKLLGEEFIISSQNPIIANNLSEPEPDFAILRFREDYYEEELPHGQDVLLIVEVADSSISYDRNVKLPLYAASGIPECWIVDVMKKEIQVYWQAEENAYRFRELFRLGDIVAAKNIDLKLAVVEVFK
jgi:Uma2 family endonuclease